MKIYSFGLGVESDETSPEVLGGKGAGLVWMDKHGINVPPGFIIPASVCNKYKKHPIMTMGQVKEAIKPWLGRMKAKFGYMPLVSVRSGARVSMPGMMDTILNVGLDESNAKEWADRIGVTCVKDSRRRLIEMFGSVVKNIPRDRFHGLDQRQAREYYCQTLGVSSFPNADNQLLEAIEAVFKSWDNERAKTYRKKYNIPEDWGTAVTVQSMVFGNMNEKSCTGVLFTRNCSSGANEVVGEFLVNAQGEDVVAGTATPLPLAKMPEWNEALTNELLEIAENLEDLKKDVQDIEFTVQNGELFILQTRTAKRSSRAAIRIAMEMLNEGMIDEDTLFKRVSYVDYLKAQGEIIDPAFPRKPKFKGIPACAGVATGTVVRSAAEVLASKIPCVLVTQETMPDDIAGIAASMGVLTMTGGATSHAAVVARGMNKPCVVGLGQSLNEFLPGSVITIDGATGNVWAEKVPVISGKNDPFVKKFEELLLAKFKNEYPNTGIIDEQDADVLDLSDPGLIKTPAVAVGKVFTAAKSRPRVIVDVRPDDNPAVKAFEEMFNGYSEGMEGKLVAYIYDNLPKDVRNKVWFITNAKKSDFSIQVQLIAQANDPKELVMAEGDFLVSVPTEPWVEKLIEMKRIVDKANPLVLGVASKTGGFVSRQQLAHMLLIK